MPIQTLPTITVYGSDPDRPDDFGMDYWFWNGDDNKWGDWWDPYDNWDGYPYEGEPAAESVDTPVQAPPVQAPPAQTPEVAEAVDAYPPTPSTWGGGYLGSGLWGLTGGEYSASPQPPLFFFWDNASAIDAKENYYLSHYGEESRYYQDPDSKSGMMVSTVSAAAMESNNMLEHLGNLMKRSLNESEFKFLKRTSFVHHHFIELAFGIGAAKKDIAAGTKPSVAIGSEVGVWAVNTMASRLIGSSLGTVVGGGLGALGFTVAWPVVVTSISVSIIASVAFDSVDLKGGLAKIINDALESKNPSLPDHPSAVEDGNLQRAALSGDNPLPRISENAADDGMTQFSDYQIYLAMREIMAHPERYPEAADILPELLASIVETSQADEGMAASSDDPGLQPPLQTVRYGEIEAQNGVKTFTGGSDNAYLFIGDDTPNEMRGGAGMNWFMPKTGHGAANTVIGNPHGYNVLDFSLNDTGVDIIIQGNDRMEEWIYNRAQYMGMYDYYCDWDDHVLNHVSALAFLRGWQASEALKTASSFWDSEDEYYNIDYVIGSSYDDIIIGDALGGMTLTGGAGNDTFVLHGGGNRVVFNNGDFAAPGSGEITTKFIHGLTTASEAHDFNARHYIPKDFGSSIYSIFRIDPDVLDFSNLDGDVNADGKQAMWFIGEHDFTGHAGELRYVTSVVHGANVPNQVPDNDADLFSTTVRLEGDRTGSGKADFFIEYTNYLNPSNANDLAIAELVGNIYPFLDDENVFFG